MRVRLSLSGENFFIFEDFSTFCFSDDFFYHDDLRALWLYAFYTFDDKERQKRLPAVDLIKIGGDFRFALVGYREMWLVLIVSGWSRQEK